MILNNVQKATEELAESAQQLQKERESQEETVRRLKQQHEDEVAELKAKVKDAEDIERQWKANNVAALLAKEEEVKQTYEKLHNTLQEIENLQVCVQPLISAMVYSPPIVFPFRPRLKGLEARIQLCKQHLQKQEKKLLQEQNMKPN